MTEGLIKWWPDRHGVRPLTFFCLGMGEYSAAGWKGRVPDDAAGSPRLRISWVVPVKKAKWVRDVDESGDVFSRGGEVNYLSWTGDVGDAGLEFLVLADESILPIVGSDDH